MEKNRMFTIFQRRFTIALEHVEKTRDKICIIHLTVMRSTRNDLIAFVTQTFIIAINHFIQGNLSNHKENACNSKNQITFI